MCREREESKFRQAMEKELRKGQSLDLDLAPPQLALLHQNPSAFLEEIKVKPHKLSSKPRSSIKPLSSRNTERVWVWKPNGQIHIQASGRTQTPIKALLPFSKKSNPTRSLQNSDPQSNPPILKKSRGSKPLGMKFRQANPPTKI